MVAYKVSGADLAEVYYGTEDGMVPGTVVQMSGAGAATVKTATTPYSSKILGVVSTQPGQVLGDSEFAAGRPLPIALVGRVPVRVTAENGTIKNGDLLTASATVQGAAMRATRPGYIIGRALTGFSGSGEGIVMAFVNTQYADPGALMDLEGGVQANSEGAPLDQLSITYDQTNNLVIRNLSGTYNFIGLGIENEQDIKVNDVLSKLDEISIAQKDLQREVDMLKLLTQGATPATASSQTASSSATFGAQNLLVKGFSEFWSNTVFKGVVEFWDRVIFRRQATFADTVKFEKSVEVGADTAGYATVKAGERLVDVRFANAYTNEPITNISAQVPVLTQQQYQDLIVAGTCSIAGGIEACQEAMTDAVFNARYVVTAKSTRGFTILLSTPASFDMTFSWTALAVKNTSSTVSQSTQDIIDQATQSAALNGGAQASGSGQVAGVATGSASLSPTPAPSTTPTPSISATPTP